MGIEHHPKAKDMPWSEMTRLELHAKESGKDAPVKLESIQFILPYAAKESVKVSMTLQNLEYDRLAANVALLGEVEAAIRGAVVNATQGELGPEKVALTLTARSATIRGTIAPLSGVPLNKVGAFLTQAPQSLGGEVEQRVRLLDESLGAAVVTTDQPKANFYTTGLPFHRSKKFGDICPQQLAKWDQRIEGQDAGEGWVKVEQLYLPLEVEGCRVLRSLRSSGPALGGGVSRTGSGGTSGSGPRADTPLPFL